MVLGIGIDTIENHRIARALSKHGEKFALRILSQDELKQWHARGQSILFLASRWAAKEAVAKALGCGIGESLGWHDVLIRNDSNGRPWVEKSLRLCELLTRVGGNKVLISITHTRFSSSAAAVLT